VDRLVENPPVRAHALRSTPTVARIRTCRERRMRPHQMRDTRAGSRASATGRRASCATGIQLRAASSWLIGSRKLSVKA
jgi:hypothetical protein